MVDHAPGLKAVHAAAQMLYHQEYGSWGYDPGNPEDDRFFQDAHEVLNHALPHLSEFLAEVQSRESHA